MQYFINMAGAEEELYKKWKEITLNSTGSDQVRYRKNENTFSVICRSITEAQHVLTLFF